MPARTWASAAATRPDPNQLGIVVTNIAGGTDACQAASMGPNVSSLFQVVVAITSNPMPGKYALGADWQASYRVADATCATAGEGAAISGILEIDSIDTVVHGAADMTFPAGRVLATFDAPICSPPAVATACARYPSCPAGHGADVKPPPSACLTFP